MINNETKIIQFMDQKLESNPEAKLSDIIDETKEWFDITNGQLLPIYNRWILIRHNKEKITCA